MTSITKTILLLAALTFSFNCHCQTQSSDPPEHLFKDTLLKNKWISDSILGKDPHTSTYKLTIYNKIEPIIGNISQFIDSVNFQSESVSWCGNDYFTIVSGKYNLIDKDKIVLTVEKVSYTGLWTKPEELRETKYLTFVITIIGDSILLTKQE